MRRNWVPEVKLLLAVYFKYFLFLEGHVTHVNIIVKWISMGLIRK